jgi:hypothetical protein
LKGIGDFAKAGKVVVGNWQNGWFKKIAVVQPAPGLGKLWFFIGLLIKWYKALCFSKMPV